MALEDLATGQDLLFYCLKKGSQQASASDDYATDVKAAIRQAYWDLLEAERWACSMAPQPGVISTTPFLQPNVLSIAGSPGIVTLSAPITPSVAGRKFYILANQAMYRITAHTAGTAQLTLDAPYVETQTAGSAYIYMDEYTLDPTCLKVWDPLYLRGQYEGVVELINEKMFKAKYGWARVAAVGLTEVATVIRKQIVNNQCVQQVQIAPWSQNAINMEYDYTQFSTLDFSGAAATDTPVFMQTDRWVIAEFALGELWKIKNDTRAAQSIDRANARLAIMQNKYLKTTSKSQMWMRPRYSLGTG